MVYRFMRWLMLAFACSAAIDRCCSTQGWWFSLPREVRECPPEGAGDGTEVILPDYVWVGGHLVPRPEYLARV